MTGLFTTTDLAGIYKVGTRRIRAIATSRDVGKKIGGHWFFTVEDIIKLKPGKTGRSRNE